MSNTVPMAIWDNMVAWERRAKTTEAKLEKIREVVDRYHLQWPGLDDIRRILDEEPS